MTWAVWTGLVLLGVVIGGLLYLRDRPLHDVDGTLVDDDGRRVATDARLERVVLTELLDVEHAPRSASELRRRLQLPVNTFYAIMDHMIQVGLVQVRTPSRSSAPRARLWTYRLTDLGLRRALRRPSST